MAGIDRKPPMSEPSLLEQQIRHCVQALDQQVGRSFDARSALLCRRLHELALAQGFERVDHILVSGRGRSALPGEFVFIVQGDPLDPGHRRARLRTLQALQPAAGDSGHARA